MTIEVLLVDDHRIVLEGLRNLLEVQSDMKVVGEATDGYLALELTRELSPDLVIMDIVMPNLNGIETTRQVVRDFPDVKVLALSMKISERVVAQMLLAGASGYLTKISALEELVQAIRAVAAGRTYLSPLIAGTVVKGFIQAIPPEEEAPCAALSGREREVLQFVAEGKTTKEIASVVHVTVKTIEAHRQHVMDKLGIRTIAGLTKHAVREGLTPLEC